MRKFVMNRDDHYYDKQNDKVYTIAKGTEIIYVKNIDVNGILGTINNGEGKGLTIIFLAKELDECK